MPSPSPGLRQCWITNLTSAARFTRKALNTPCIPHIFSRFHHVGSSSCGINLLWQPGATHWPGFSLVRGTAGIFPDISLVNLILVGIKVCVTTWHIELSASLEFVGSLSAFRMTIEALILLSAM